MLSRRSVRVKIMQVFYAMGRDTALDFNKAQSSYRLKVQQTFELYLFSLRYIIRICNYSREDGSKKKAKLRPTQDDLLFQPRLIEHPLMENLRNNEDLYRLFHTYQLEEKIDEDIVRLAYNKFSQKEEYKAYSTKKEIEEQEQIDILLLLLKECINNESFVETIEDQYPNWQDDKSLVIGALKKNFKALPLRNNFYEDFRPGRETTVDFGEALMEKVYYDDEALHGTIEPILKNWDADRVAIIDMILLKMALTEFTNFPSIPTKVTLNEFVEISKMYSTEKSKDFINGVLDRLLKKLNAEGKIKKAGRGLLE